MNHISCSCGDDCDSCESCGNPKCECFCDLYTGHETREDKDEDDDDEYYDEKDEDEY